MPVGRVITVLSAVVIVTACSQDGSPSGTLHSIGAVFSGELDQRQRLDHQSLDTVLKRLKASEQSQAQMGQDLEQIRAQLANLEADRGCMKKLEPLAETLDKIKTRLDVVQKNQQSHSEKKSGEFERVIKKVFD